MVLVTHDCASHLPELFAALLHQLRDDDELVLVDNASHDGTVAQARRLSGRVKVIENLENLGFAGGCEVGVRATRAPLLLFLNPDSEPHAHCLDRLRRASKVHPEWAAWQPAVLLEDGRINTSGGIVHFLGIGYAGDCERPISALPEHDREIAFPSGAALVLRRDAWLQARGMDREYFMYGEDLDLGLRLWLMGRRVGLVPAARVTHRYEFHKGAQKWFWLERNRWRTVLSVYPTSLLWALAPAFALSEAALLILALRNRWLGAKLRAQAAVIGGLPATIRRRRAVQAGRRIEASEFAGHLSSSLDSPYLTGAHSRWIRWPQAGYWGLVCRALRALER